VTVPDPYKVLQVDPSAETDVIEAAYKRLAKKYHPDVTPGPEAQAKMVQLNLARDILRDPVRRAALDRARVRAQATSARVIADEGRAHATPGHAVRHRTRGEVHAAPGNTPPPATPERAAGGAGRWPFPGTSGQGAADGEPVSSSWTSGRSTEGYAYDAASMGTPDGHGAAGPPPGNPTGSILTFGRYSGWTLGEIARVDLEYLEWLDRTPIGRGHATEIDKLLRARGRRRATSDAPETRHGLFRRR
jgi:curved DNA-binding protein CbpA